MRFAYIDSNGNEVPIPSVDALALRIELGAITDETQLYDAQADQWGAATTHEIYHTLSRDTGGAEGLMPAPPVAPAADPSSVAKVEEPEPPSPDEAPREEATPAEPAGADDRGTTAEELGLTLADAPPADDPANLGLTLADPVEDDPSDGDTPTTSTGAQDEADAADATTGSDPASPGDLPEPVTGPSAGSGADDGGGFDFGEMSAGLELESDDGDDDDAMDFSGAMADEDPLGSGTADFSGGMDLESTHEFDASGFDANGSDSLDLEAPMSDFSPEDPPGWMEEGLGVEPEDVMDLSSVSAAAEVTPEARPVKERTPKNKPSTPKLRRQRSLAPAIVGIMILLAFAVGGYAAWPILSARFASDGGEVVGVGLPQIPEALLPQMRSAAEGALGDVYGTVRAGWAAANPTTDPGRDWLGGAYLANASRYPDAETFWNGITTLLTSAGGVDLQVFDTALQVRLDAMALSDADAALIRARADSGFVAAEPARAAVHAQLGRLADAALRLHTFLVANEASIDYVPASTATTDPVLEADPATPEIRVAMEDLIDEVTNAMFDFDYRDQVTAELLWRAFVTRVQNEGIE